MNILIAFIKMTILVSTCMLLYHLILTPICTDEAEADEDDEENEDGNT